ncbi:MAG: hypothetical protein JXB36_08300 [Gammaproteobacteria bacterium]|nr:hypothetical protein [Gammaproteobacteria bacterium]
MGKSRLLCALAAAAAVQALPAHAQFGYSLPRNDFTWRWGDADETARRRSSDFSVSGGEAGFRCDLQGELRLGSRWTPGDIRQLENDLRVSAFFIRSAAEAMNALDLRREIEWATLDCRKPAESEPDPEAEQEKLDRAREKMIEEMRRRRARD